MLTKLVFLILCNLNLDGGVMYDESPSCLYQSEICLGKTQDWIDSYTCIYESGNKSYQYSILNQPYLKIGSGKNETHIDRFIGLGFDEEDRLHSYRIHFASFGGGGYIETSKFYSLIFEQIGIPQLSHYTHLEKNDYQDYVGTYEYDDCLVEFSIPSGDPIKIEIVVTGK